MQRNLKSFHPEKQWLILKRKMQKMACLNHQLKNRIVRVRQMVHPSLKHIAVCTLVNTYIQCVNKAFVIVIVGSILQLIFMNTDMHEK